MVAINVSLGSGADQRASTGKIAIRPVEEHKSGNFLALSAWVEYALSSEPLVWDLPAGQFYEVREIEPRGKRRVFEVPSGTTDYADLVFLEENGGSGVYVIEPVNWVLLSTDPLPADALPGQTYFETDTNVVGMIGA